MFVTSDERGWGYAHIWEMGVSMALYGDTTTLKQEPVGRHVAPLGHVILVLATSRLTKKQHIPILFILV
jgi:hypothetical protein